MVKVKTGEEPKKLRRNSFTLVLLKEANYATK